jgi:AraC family transcriptional regulator
LGTLSIPGLALTESRHDPNTRLPWHRHDFAGFLFVFEGAYQEQFSRHEYWSSGRGVLYKPAEIRHANAFGPAAFHSFIVEIVDAEQFHAGRLPEGPRYFPEGPLSGVGARIYGEFQAPDASSAIVIDGLFRALIGYAARAAASVEKRAPDWLARAKERMAQEPAAIGSIHDLAREAAVHPDHFTRAFRQHFGVLPGDWLRERRLARACELLRDARLAISDIALACGFSDQSHMTRYFRRQYGITPAIYRERFRS